MACVESWCFINAWIDICYQKVKTRQKSEQTEYRAFLQFYILLEKTES